MYKNNPKKIAVIEGRIVLIGSLKATFGALKR